MARQKTPIAFLKDKSINKSTRDEMEQLENKLKGSSNQIHEVPQYLSKLAQVYYLFLVSQIEIGQLLCNLDKPLLEQLAVCMSHVKELDTIIDKEGVIVYDKHGNSKEHVAVKTKMTIQKQVNQIGNLLGITPSGRMKLEQLQKAKIEMDNDPVLRILRGEDPY